MIIYLLKNEKELSAYPYKAQLPYKREFAPWGCHLKKLILFLSMVNQFLSTTLSARGIGSAYTLFLSP
jgi:hypothetical protein